MTNEIPSISSTSTDQKQNLPSNKAQQQLSQDPPQPLSSIHDDVTTTTSSSVPPSTSPTPPSSSSVSSPSIVPPPHYPTTETKTDRSDPDLSHDHITTPAGVTAETEETEAKDSNNNNNNSNSNNINNSNSNNNNNDDDDEGENLNGDIIDKTVQFVPKPTYSYGIEQMLRSETIRQLELAWDAQRALAMRCVVLPHEEKERRWKKRKRRLTVVEDEVVKNAVSLSQSDKEEVIGFLN